MLTLTPAIEAAVVDQCIENVQRNVPDGLTVVDGTAARVIERPFVPALVVYIPGNNQYGPLGAVCVSTEWPASAMLTEGVALNLPWTEQDFQDILDHNGRWSM